MGSSSSALELHVTLQSYWVGKCPRRLLVSYARALCAHPLGRHCLLIHAIAVGDLWQQPEPAVHGHSTSVSQLTGTYGVSSPLILTISLWESLRVEEEKQGGMKRLAPNHSFQLVKSVGAPAGETPRP